MIELTAKNKLIVGRRYENNKTKLIPKRQHQYQTLKE